MIAVIDYGIGNLNSVVKAFNYIDIPVSLTDKPEVINKSDALLLPGVGAFGEGMDNLKKKGLDKIIKKNIAEGKPFLGICLGLQLLFSCSEENKGVEGLDLIKGSVQKFSLSDVPKIPHIGWNQVDFGKSDDPLFTGLTDNNNLYFVHSFFVEPEDEGVVLGKTTYGNKDFASIIRKDNIWGIQCHPEKSSKVGLKILKNFGEVIN